MRNRHPVSRRKRWFVYVISNTRGEFYTGITFDNDPERRLREHNAGTGAKYTRGRAPWSLVYVETGFEGRAAAQAREHTLKHDLNFKRRLRTSSRRVKISGFT